VKKIQFSDVCNIINDGTEPVLIYGGNQLEIQYILRDTHGSYDKIFYINFEKRDIPDSLYILNYSPQVNPFLFFRYRYSDYQHLDFMIDRLSRFLINKISKITQLYNKKLLHEILKILIKHFYESNKFEDYTYVNFMHDLQFSSSFLKSFIDKSIILNLASFIEEQDKQLKDEIANQLRLNLENILNNKIENNESSENVSSIILQSNAIELLHQFTKNIQKDKYKEHFLKENNPPSEKDKKVEIYNFPTNITKDSEWFDVLKWMIINFNDNNIYPGKKRIFIDGTNIDLSSIIKDSKITISFFQNNFAILNNILEIKNLFLMKQITLSQRNDFNKFISVNNDMEIFKYFEEKEMFK